MARSADRLQSGKRDRLVTIQQLTAGVDPESGEPTETWTTLVSQMWASKTNRSGDETFKSDQESARFDCEWEINWREDMNPDTLDLPKVRRLLFGTRVHDIVEAVEVGRRAGLCLYTLASAQVPTP